VERMVKMILIGSNVLLKIRDFLGRISLVSIEYKSVGLADDPHLHHPKVGLCCHERQASQDEGSERKRIQELGRVSKLAYATQ